MLVVLWIGYFIVARGGGRDDAAHLLALHWLPRLHKVNYIMWWCATM